MRVSPQDNNHAIDGRTTRHSSYAISQRRRKRVEEVFGWDETVGLSRKLRHRGTAPVGWIFTFTQAAYNLVRPHSGLAGCTPLEFAVRYHDQVISLNLGFSQRVAQCRGARHTVLTTCQPSSPSYQVISYSYFSTLLVSVLKSSII